jgi:hypothetical protein
LALLYCVHNFTEKQALINEGWNQELARKCKTLAGYSVFVGKVREYEKAGMTLEEAIKKAVEYCLENDILKEFFEKNATEELDILKLKRERLSYSSVFSFNGKFICQFN